MDPVHFIAGNAPLCGRPDALWCTILREAVTCPSCLAVLQGEASAPRPGARAAGALQAKHA